jgi:hypothetical protein
MQGSFRLGFTQWSHQGDALNFALYASPDANHKVSVTLAGDSFRGTGLSAGGGDGAPPSDWGPDQILGRRTGPADRSVCIKAVEKLAR